MKRYIPDADYFVRLVPLPFGVFGATMPNDDSTYSVYLNTRYPEGRQLAAYIHEVRHIQNEDFYNGEDIDTIEQMASV